MYSNIVLLFFGVLGARGQHHETKTGLPTNVYWTRWSTSKSGGVPNSELRTSWSVNGAAAAPTSESWTGRSTSNPNGFPNAAITCPPRAYLTKVIGFEQGNYGIVDMEMHCSDGQAARETNNNNGHQNPELACPDGMTQLQSREQGGYGIVDFRITCASGQVSTSTGNLNGAWNDVLSCDRGEVITGIQTWQQGHYGIIDFRMQCGHACKATKVTEELPTFLYDDSEEPMAAWRQHYGLVFTSFFAGCVLVATMSAIVKCAAKRRDQRAEMYSALLAA